MKDLKKPYIAIEGGKVLKGSLKANGAKNSVLPILFSTILAEGDYKIENVPNLQDVFVTKEILESLGFQIAQQKNSLSIKNNSIKTPEIPKAIAQKMRASFLCLGPLVAKYRQAKVPLPGGCKIGTRPIDLHLEALKVLGAEIVIDGDFVYAKAPQGLKGGIVELAFPTVGGTENILMASVLAEGTTIIKNRALEPEIEDLIVCLKKMGANIESIDERTVKVEGVKALKSFETHHVIPDRIEVGTFLLAGAITGGEVSVTNCNPHHLDVFLSQLKNCGFDLKTSKNSIALKSTQAKNPVHIKTEVHPGFPTDLQSQFAALMTQLHGESSVEESIFENRFRYAESFKKFGADIDIQGSKKICIKGPSSLKGAIVQATDLRASAGLILTALAAEGESFVTDIFHLDRGYEGLDIQLESLGASIKRVV